MRISPQRLKCFADELLQAHGLDSLQANVLTDILIWCDQVGRPNQGVLRIPALIKRIQHGVINTPPNLQFEQKAENMVLLNGDNAIGHYVAHQAMIKATELAKKNGVGIVGVFNSNFFGAGAYYVNYAAEQGLIGLAMSNSYPKVVPHGGRAPVFGTNPFAFACPRKNKKNILVDMATSAMAGSTLRSNSESCEATSQPVGIDKEGRPTHDLKEVADGALLPFGGAKGYCLGLMVEIMSGLITGAGISHQVKSMYECFTEGGNNGHFLLAIDIEKMMEMEQYYQRIEELIQFIKMSVPGDSSDSVLYPGENRWQCWEKSEREGVSLESALLVQFEQLAMGANIDLPW